MNVQAMTQEELLAVVSDAMAFAGPDGHIPDENVPAALECANELFKRKQPPQKKTHELLNELRAIAYRLNATIEKLYGNPGADQLEFERKIILEFIRTCQDKTLGKDKAKAVFWDVYSCLSSWAKESQRVKEKQLRQWINARIDVTSEILGRFSHYHGMGELCKTELKQIGIAIKKDEPRPTR